MKPNSSDELFLSNSDEAFSYIRKESLDIFNRLHSIGEDVLFVDQIHETYPTIPLLPNLRCGAWYTNPMFATPIPAYFKSTDGHCNNWSFNLRRANLHLLPLIFEQRGIILVDSTRSGKRMPDALSKTVPIWCTVINRAMLIRHPSLKLRNRENAIEWSTTLYTPPSTVSNQEHHQIEQHLDSWAQDLAASSFTLPLLPCPLRPFWITPANSTFPTFSNRDDGLPKFLPIICVSASKQVQQGVERRTGGFSYIQGSGDDHELWGMGLTPEMFWEHRVSLLAADRTDFPKLVSDIVRNPQCATAASNSRSPSPIHQVKGRLLVASMADVPQHFKDERVHYLVLTSSADQESKYTGAYTYIPSGSGKKDRTHFLQAVLPQCMDITKKSLEKGENVCIAGDSGKDTSVGVALVALQLFFDDNGKYVSSNSTHKTDKQHIRTRLEWIIESRPQANPSRDTLKRVNEYLLTLTAFRGVPSISSMPTAYSTKRLT